MGGQVDGGPPHVIIHSLNKYLAQMCHTSEVTNTQACLHVLVGRHTQINQ